VLQVLLLPLPEEAARLISAAEAAVGRRGLRCGLGRGALGGGRGGGRGAQLQLQGGGRQLEGDDVILGLVGRLLGVCLWGRELLKRIQVACGGGAGPGGQQRCGVKTQGWLFWDRRLRGQLEGKNAFSEPWVMAPLWNDRIPCMHARMRACRRVAAGLAGGPPSPELVRPSSSLSDSSLSSSLSRLAAAAPAAEGPAGPRRFLGVTFPSARVRRKRMPQALQRIGLPFGPLRHWGLLLAPQWQQGPHSSCLPLPRRDAAAAAAAALPLHGVAQSRAVAAAAAAAATAAAAALALGLIGLEVAEDGGPE
jgi:hypothetical protein